MREHGALDGRPHCVEALVHIGACRRVTEHKER
jgi:hypothetical protein